MKTDLVWWILGIAWMLIGLSQQIGGDHTQGLIDIVIGAEFIGCAGNHVGRSMSEHDMYLILAKVDRTKEEK